MKSAITTLLEYFEQQLSLQRESHIKYTGEEALVDAIDVCKNIKSVEVQQIKDAFNQGYREGFVDACHTNATDKDISEYDDADIYYINTY